MWSKVHWEMIEPVVKIRTLRARLASIQLSLIEFNLLIPKFVRYRYFPMYSSSLMKIKKICKHSIMNSSTMLTNYEL